MGVLMLQDVEKAIRQNQIDERSNRKQKDFFMDMQEIGRIVDFQPHNTDMSWVVDCYKGQDIYVVGAGYSLKDFDFEWLRGKNTIAINHVVEYWDGFKWLLFLDRRFIQKTTKNIDEYINDGGHVFASNMAGLIEKKGVDVFKPLKRNSSVDLPINNGLYCNVLSGLCALHLAIYTGAARIFLLGFDCGTGHGTDHHLSTDYLGKCENLENDKVKRQKYMGTAKYFDVYSEYKDRIYNCSEISNIETFRKISQNDMKLMTDGEVEVVNKGKDINRLTICHIGTLPLASMGDITRVIVDRCKGRHIYHAGFDNIPNADIYILHCFIAENKRMIHFQKPNQKAKVVSIIHSSSSCLPAINSDLVIVLTNNWIPRMNSAGFKNVVSIYGGIDTSIYTNIPDYNKKVFGRITRWSKGKVHQDFPNVAVRLLNKYKDSECRIYTNAILPKYHDRFIVDGSILINDWESKAKKLSELSVFAACHNTFIETFSIAALEAMAARLPIILFSAPLQQPMVEMLGGCAILTSSIKEFEIKLETLLLDFDMKKEFGEKARKRAEFLNNENMVKKYNYELNRLFN